jgi:hypothetical protein
VNRQRRHLAPILLLLPTTLPQSHTLPRVLAPTATTSPKIPRNLQFYTKMNTRRSSGRREERVPDLTEAWLHQRERSRSGEISWSSVRSSTVRATQDSQLRANLRIGRPARPVQNLPWPSNKNHYSKPSLHLKPTQSTICTSY